MLSVKRQKAAHLTGGGWSVPEAAALGWSGVSRSQNNPCLSQLLLLRHQGSLLHVIQNLPACHLWHQHHRPGVEVTQSTDAVNTTKAGIYKKNSFSFHHDYTYKCEAKST